MPHKPGVGAIFGIVSEDGTAKDDSPVYLMDMRRDLGEGQMKLLAKQKTRPDGGFTFAGLDPEYDGYAVIATDEDGSPEKNALIQDRVQPVPAHAGAGAYSEWYARIMKSGATAGIVGWPVAENSPMVPFGLGSRVLTNGTAAEPTEMMGLPGAPNIGGVETQPSGGMVTYAGPERTVANSMSLEMVIDIDAVSPVGNLVIDLGYSSGTGSGKYGAVGDTPIPSDASFSHAHYTLTVDHSTKVITLQRNSGSSSNNNKSTLDTCSLSSYSGVLHVAVVFTSGTSVVWYVNGASVRTFSTSATLTYDTNALTQGRMVYSVGIRPGADFIIGPIVYFARPLTATEVEEHYDALFDNDLLPVLMGYAAEIMAESPIWYYRLNDADAASGFSSELAYRDVVTLLSPSYTLLTTNDAPNTITGEPGPVSGIPATKLQSAAKLSSSTAGVMGFPFVDQCCFTCWVKFDEETPVVEETIFVAKGWATTTTGDGFIRVARTTAGKIKLAIYINASVTTVTFDFVPAYGEWVNLWIIADQATNSASVLCGDSDSAPTLKDTKSTASGNLYSVLKHSGNEFPNNGCAIEIGANFTGTLCEVALLPLKIPLARIQEIWAAKDIP